MLELHEDVVDPPGQVVVGHQGGDRHHQATGGGEERLPDPAGEQTGRGLPLGREHVEGLDHAGHRPQKPKERRDLGGHAQNPKALRKTNLLLQERCLERRVHRRDPVGHAGQPGEQEVAKRSTMNARGLERGLEFSPPERCLHVPHEPLATDAFTPQREEPFEEDVGRIQREQEQDDEDPTPLLHREHSHTIPEWREKYDMGMRWIRDDALKPVAEKVLAGERLSFEDGLRLYQTRDLTTLMRLANRVREQRHGDKTYFVHSLRFSQTNICYVGCTFCAFARRFGEEGAWDYSVDESIEWIEARYQPGMTEIHIASGHHPKRPLDYYVSLVAAIRERFPTLQVKAFTAAEISHIAKVAKTDVKTVLQELKAAGLVALPGGGAEIFSERVRKEIARSKIPAETWLEVHRIAHELGLPTNATMLYGHVETLEERLDHMDRLRRLQDETGGFVSFIPLAFQPDGNPLAKALGKTEAPSATDDLRNLAVARLYLDNFPHIKGYWATITPEVTQISLDWGVSDIDGTLIEEKIVHMAGAKAPEGLAKGALIELIQRAGRVPIERDALYREIRVYEPVPS